MINFDRQTCRDLDASATREWLETNGIGGFAAGTVAGVHTRRYHGLLVAAVAPPTARAVLLSKIEETLIVNDQRYELSANRYPNAIHPQGFRLLNEFRLAPFPTWTFEIGDFEIEKTVFMPQNENTIVVDYTITKNPSSDAASEIVLELRPLAAFRNFHSLRNNRENFDTNFQAAENTISFKPETDLPAIHFGFQNGSVAETKFWYRNFEYAVEQERGFDFREDLFQPFVLRFDLSARANVSVVVSTELRRVSENAASLRRSEIERRRQIVEQANVRGWFLETLVAAADQFIVARGTEKTVIAGYPWFGDWGRDTMIALPGLTLATNRPEIARSILLEFSKYISEGMLPNRFPDQGDAPEYNTVDATLWYFEAIRQYVEKTGDEKFVERELYAKLADVIVWHLRGTRFNIRVDTDGLICAGDKDTQLTWMDAKHGAVAFTPRDGKAVEIQALWYNALRIMQQFAARFKDQTAAAQYAAMAEMAQISFVQTFWNKREECLFDCINGERDGSIRPNQIFAVSLTHSMLSSEQAKKVVRKVEAELLTAFGLRSLSPRDPNYAARYEGDGFSRDSRYHQGTVWTWLAGAFFTAYQRVFSDEPDTAQKLKTWLEPYQQHLREAGIGQISEIFDGDAPHRARGCFAQAWSVAEILRVAREIQNDNL